MRILSISETKNVSGSHSGMKLTHALSFFAEKSLWFPPPITEHLMAVNAHCAKSIVSPNISISTDSHNTMATSETRVVINNNLSRG